MPAFDTESQFKFLIACIKHSQAGKVDFTEVASECNIVTKGAAAKRYERLMKQHGIQPTGNTGGGSGVKKEAKDPASKDPAKSRKKRKLDKVEEDVGDIDEPIKGEVKNEDAVKSELVKSESVKVEQSGGLGVIPAAQTGTSSSVSSSSLAGATNSQNNDDDDDDEVLVVSATQRTNDNANVLGFDNGANQHSHNHNHHMHHHHSHAHAHHAHAHPHSPTPNGMIAGIHNSFDYGTNMGFPPQTLPPMTMSRATSNSFPYGFNTGSPWFYPHSHDTPASSSPSAYGGRFWQGMSTPEPQQQSQQHQHKGGDHDVRMDG